MASTELSESTGIENTMAWSSVVTVELIVAPGDRFHIEHSRMDLQTFGDLCGSLVVQKHGELQTPPMGHLWCKNMANCSPPSKKN